jgi:hypothetical protein
MVLRIVTEGIGGEERVETCVAEVERGAAFVDRVCGAFCSPFSSFFFLLFLSFNLDNFANHPFFNLSYPHRTRFYTPKRKEKIKRII